jgi:acetyl-CoA acetyltransferase
LPALALLTRLFHSPENRRQVDIRAVDKVVIGCTTQTGGQGGHLARTAGLLAGWDDGVSGYTVDPFWASGIEAVAQAAVIIMLTAAQFTVEKAVARVGLTLSDIGLFEVGEAFAALMVKFQSDLCIDPERLNVNGGNLAMGHVFAASGAILTIPLFDEMERRDLRFGVAANSGAAWMRSTSILPSRIITRPLPNDYAMSRISPMKPV